MRVWPRSRHALPWIPNVREPVDRLEELRSVRFQLCVLERVSEGPVRVLSRRLLSNRRGELRRDVRESRD